MLLRPQITLTMDGAPLANAAVRVEGNRITEIGVGLLPLAGEEVVELPGQVLLPGLINAHCHLDYTGFKGAIFSGIGFSEWIKRINAIKRSFSNEDYLAGIEKGFQMLMDGGCTTVCNIEAIPDLFPLMAKPPIRTWWFLELIDIRSRAFGEEALTGMLDFFEARHDWPGGFGLSPHAPYTASIELYRLAKHCGQELKMPFTTHIAESVEEQEMFLYGHGAMYDFLKGIGRNMEDCGQGSALSHLLEFGLLDEKCLAVHMNYIQEYDYKLLQKNPLHVVHCPRCHAYFNHARFPYERLREAGCDVSLGTDSLASNDVLDLRAEIAQFRKDYPTVSAEDCLRMVTTIPAKQIGMEGQLGVIRPGALADLVAFPLPEQTNPYLAVVAAKGRPTFFMVDGERK
ncbi:MAG: amidohydrolase family protein [Verrucomicrobiales bacterium]|nr:amidohydrolase family protein [Verrucomicrobiales bacterium]